MKKLGLVFTILALQACSEKGIDAQSPAASGPEATPEIQESPLPSSDGENTAGANAVRLDQVLAMQDDATKARYNFRNPKQTIEFFGLTPGMAVAEALPGGGWYTKILVPYLGAEGRVLGIDYDYSMWQNFDWVDDEFLATRKAWTDTWPQEAKAWYSEDAATVDAATFGTLDENLTESFDAVLFIRALHNLNRFEDKGAFLSNALKESHRILKPGGIVGVVQHQAPEDKSDEWADGSRGYIKKSAVIAAFEKAGFSLVSETDINTNPNDVPGEDDIVWRLPPSLSTSKDNEELKNQMTAIGESNRMTLLFKK